LIQTGKITVSKSLAELSFAQAGMIGLWQATAVLPGVSRAGAVMIGLLLMGYRQDEAAKFSFMLAVPTIIAAAGFDFLKMRGELSVLSVEAFTPLIIGCAAAFFTSLLIVRWFIGYLKKHSLAAFGWYRIAAAGLLALVLGV
jgi:undecaprenyl-diphosphatase